MSEQYTLTLVASDNPLSESILGAVEVVLMEYDVGEVAPPKWLSENKAIDFYLEKCPEKEGIEAIKNVLTHVRVDFFIQPEEGRRKKLLISDMDSTIIAEETLDEIASELGLKPLVSAITERAMKGELDFETALRKRVALLAGKSIDALEKVRKNIHFNQGAHILVQTMRRHGALCILVSGGFTYYTSYVARECEFHHHHSNDMQVKNKKITGYVEEPILGAGAKLSFMREYMAQKRLKPDQVIAIGDGANDLEMIKNAGLGIGYYPKPVLEQETLNVIRFGDLTAALYAQGYQEKEFRRPIAHNTIRMKK
ncbi:MAG: phosphoserine phosphatase SerB [Bdellovibrionales bacterium]